MSFESTCLILIRCWKKFWKSLSKCVWCSIGIRVTKDVIREVCRLYAGDYHTIRDKWVDAIEKAALRKQKEHDDLIRTINDTADAKDDHRDTYRDVYAKYGGDSKFDRYRDDDPKGSNGDRDSTYRSRGNDSKREKQVDALILTGEEEDLGVDVQKLCDDIVSGRGLIIVNFCLLIVQYTFFSPDIYPYTYL